MVVFFLIVVAEYHITKIIGMLMAYGKRRREENMCVLMMNNLNYSENGEIS